MFFVQLNLLSINLAVVPEKRELVPDSRCSFRWSSNIREEASSRHPPVARTLVGRQTDDGHSFGLKWIFQKVQSFVQTHLFTLQQRLSKVNASAPIECQLPNSVALPIPIGLCNHFACQIVCTKNGLLQFDVAQRDEWHVEGLEVALVRSARFVENNLKLRKL